MGDGFIQGIIVPDTEMLIPELDNVFAFQVSEEIPAGSPASPLSAAKASISGLDVISGHVFGLVLEERLHTAWPTSDPWIPSLDWIGKGNFNLDWDVGVSFAAQVNAGGISAAIAGYGSSKAGIFHDFRVGFTNADGVMAILQGDATIVLGTVAGTDPAIFTRTAGTWGISDWVGRVATFLSGSTVLMKRPVYSMTTTTVTVRDDGIVLTSCDGIRFDDDNWQYDVGIAGFGQEFNGINDFSEYAEVLNLEIQLSSGGLWVNAGADMDGLQARLRWKNMYNNADIAAHPHADGVSRDTVQAQWNSIIAYVVFMYKATGALDPAANYPSPTEANGTWYLVHEMPAPHIAEGTLPKIEAIIEVPQGSTLAFWIGVKTGSTESTSQQNKQGRPIYRDL